VRGRERERGGRASVRPRRRCRGKGVRGGLGVVIGVCWGGGRRLPTTGCWLAALGTHRRSWGGQLALGAVLREGQEAVGSWGETLTGEFLGAYSGSGKCLNTGAHSS